MKELYKLPIAEVVKFEESFITLSTGGNGGDGNYGNLGDEED